jgi:succinoglycan biosynthesis transport protein ExoP
LQEAREDLASARAAAATLRQRLSANQQSVQMFTSRFNEYRALQQELTHLEGLRQNAVERLAALEAEESGRMPKVEVLEAAATPRTPASPWYARDAVLALVGALAAALLTMAIVELFNRPLPQPATVVLPQAWVPVPVQGRAGAFLGIEAQQTLLQPVHPPALPTPRPLPRELSARELSALLDTADGGLRASMALLLMGLTGREVVELRYGDLDRPAACVRVPGAAQRSVPLPANVMALLPDDGRPADAPLLAANGNSIIAESELDAAILYAAHDAGIEDAADVTAAALHHTYVAFLVRQGARFSELVRLVGPLRVDTLAAYRPLAPDGPRQSLDRVDRVLPAVRALPSA